jgi:UDP-3-O-[3-hydroxymyristoyl] N-acetylglucosamine deacetylase
VIAEHRVLNPEGLRYRDEFVRHKMLDAVADLSLAGAPLCATYRTVHGGHKLNYAALSALMSDTSAWAWGEGEPSRPARSHADLTSGLALPAFAPDVS